MTKFMIVALVQVTVLFVMQMSVEPCTDEVIKEMIVNVCGMGGIKRLFPDSSLGQNFKEMVTDDEGEFKHLVGNIDEVDLLLKTSNNNKPIGGGTRKATIIKPARPGSIMEMFRVCCVNKNCTAKDFKRICEKK